MAPKKKIIEPTNNPKLRPVTPRTPPQRLHRLLERKLPAIPDLARHHHLTNREALLRPFHQRRRIKMLLARFKQRIMVYYQNESRAVAAAGERRLESYLRGDLLGLRVDMGLE